MNTKITANSQLLTINQKQTNKQKTSKQLEQEQNHSNGDHMKGEWEGEMGEKVQGKRSINCRYKIERGRLRIVWEMEKLKNLYV